MKNSKKLFAQAKKYIPGGVNSPVRAFASVNSVPFFVKKALPVIKTLEGLILIPHLNIYESNKDKIKVNINGLYNSNDNNDF